MHGPNGNDKETKEYFKDGHLSPAARLQQLSGQKTQNPASVFTDPLILDVYLNMVRVVKDNGPFLNKKVGYLGTTVVTFEDGRAIPITIDLRKPTGEVFIGKSDDKADFTLTVSDDTFIKLK